MDNNQCAVRAAGQAHAGLAAAKAARAERTPPPPSDAQRRLVAGSQALWVKADGFVENGR